MSYLGEPDRPSAWEIGCNFCGRGVKTKADVPRGWTFGPDAWKHACPKCRKPAPRPPRR